jgi:hypothetical protein
LNRYLDRASLLILTVAYKLAREARGGYTGWRDHCHDFEAQYARNLYGFANTSIPEVGGVDIAAVFIRRDKFVATNIFISKSRCSVCTFSSLWYVILRYS